MNIISNRAMLHPMLKPAEEKYTPPRTPYGRGLEETGFQNDATPQQGLLSFCLCLAVFNLNQNTERTRKQRKENQTSSQRIEKHASIPILSGQLKVVCFFKILIHFSYCKPHMLSIQQKTMLLNRTSQSSEKINIQ